VFIKRLLINSDLGVIRDISFHAGLNLIVDKTPDSDNTRTGNNVGKTTVLKLIDFCLDGGKKEIYEDPETPGAVYAKVRDFLVDHKVTVCLELVDRLDTPLPRTVSIERNFADKRNSVRKIDGEQFTSKMFTKHLAEKLIPSLDDVEKPTLRQAIAHNLRISNWKIEHTVRLLNQNTTKLEYEALYLFLLGFPQSSANDMQKVTRELKAEQSYGKKLLNGRTLGGYKAVLGQLNAEIEVLEEKRRKLGVAQDVEWALERMDGVQTRIGQLSSTIEQANIRVAVIGAACAELKASISDVDVSQIKLLYEEARLFIPNLQHTFEELVAFHNTMLEERVRFISADLPRLEASLRDMHKELENLLREERSLSDALSVELASSELERNIVSLNNCHRSKGECEALIRQVEESDGRIKRYEAELASMGEELYSPTFHEKLDERVALLNRHFSRISDRLYGERYVLSCDLGKDRKTNKPCYEFSVQSLHNISGGKKQGEILCFDFAYTSFADSQGIECLHFLLYDKKEMMHGNQLSQIDEVARDCNVQVIVSILEDKLPDEMAEGNEVVLRLSQESKLFRIEELLERE
jgi:uncharacterized protein YydD (DUF2326 family)